MLNSVLSIGVPLVFLRQKVPIKILEYLHNVKQRFVHRRFSFVCPSRGAYCNPVSTWESHTSAFLDKFPESDFSRWLKFYSFIAAFLSMVPHRLVGGSASLFLECASWMVWDFWRSPGRWVTSLDVTWRHNVGFLCFALFRLIISNYWPSWKQIGLVLEKLWQFLFSWFSIHFSQFYRPASAKPA